MTERISAAFDMVSLQVKECQQKIDQLTMLKEIYEKVDEDELNGLIGNMNENDPTYPIYGVLTLATRFPTLNNVNEYIDWYQKRMENWIKIRNQIGQD